MPGAMTFESLQDVQNRVADIQARIEDIVGGDAPIGGDVPSAASSGAQGPFAAVLATAMQTPSPMGPSAWDDLIQEASAKTGVNAGLLKSVMMSESGGNPNAVSHAGAMGLMQLMPATARSLGVTDPYDARQNLFAGARYLKGLLSRFQSPELAVAAYNAGSGAVRRYNGVPPYRETQNYVTKVMARWHGGGSQ